MLIVWELKLAYCLACNLRDPFVRMNDNPWQQTFESIYTGAVAAWKAGRRTPESMFSGEDIRFLKENGCTEQELFDFVDDGQDWGEPDFDTVLQVQTIRRDYFLDTLGGSNSGRIASMETLPSKDEALEGIVWLPRIIRKARLKLLGEMPDELMYGCGGDRAFVKRVNMTLPQFLILVRDSGGDDRRIVEAVKSAISAAA